MTEFILGSSLSGPAANALALLSLLMLLGVAFLATYLFLPDKQKAKWRAVWRTSEARTNRWVGLFLLVAAGISIGFAGEDRSGTFLRYLLWWALLVFLPAGLALLGWSGWSRRHHPIEWRALSEGDISPNKLPPELFRTLVLAGIAGLAPGVITGILWFRLGA